MVSAVREFSSSSQLDIALTQYVTDALSSALEIKGHASLVVSADSENTAFLSNLSEQDLNWSSVYITLTGEQCLLDAHPNSESKRIKDSLLKNLASEANYLPLYIQGETQKNIQQRFINHRVLSECYDVVVLNMGLDGHVAAIYPDADERDQALNANVTNNILLTKPAGSESLRLTQTRQRLLHSGKLALVLIGVDKMSVLDEAKQGLNAALPVSYFVSQDDPPLDVFFCRH